MASPSSQQYHFVLVHGAGHGAWCWYRLRTLLEALGHKVSCIDLTSCGIDPTNFDVVLSFQQYNEPLTTFMSSLSSHEKVILVGHSISGLNITDALYKYTDKIKVVVYIAAFMSKTGYSLIDILTHISAKDFQNVHLQKLLETLIGAAETAAKWEVVFGCDMLPAVLVKPDYQRLTYYHMSPVEDSTLAGMLLRPTPVLPLLSVQFDGNGDVDSVPRVYIRTLKDQLMSQNSQDKMISGWPPSKVFAVSSDHCAMLSVPDALCHYLLEAASSF